MLHALMAELRAEVKAEAFTSGDWHMLSKSAIASSARPLLKNKSSNIDMVKMEYEIEVRLTAKIDAIEEDRDSDSDNDNDKCHTRGTKGRQP